MGLSLFTKLLTTGRSIKESGYNKEGQLDNSNKNLEVNIIEPTVRNIYKMDRSTYHTIYILNNESIVGTGYNGQGQLGTGSNSNCYTPTPILVKNVEEVVCGGYHSIFITKDNLAYATGANEYGQCGVGHTDNIFTPVKLKSITSIKSVRCGGYHTFFILKSGDVYACGKNDYGQLGFTSEDTNVLVPTLLPINNIEDIYCGADYTIFRTKDNKLLASGYNGYGQLCLGNYTDISAPTPMKLSHNNIDISPTSIDKIVCGSHHTLFLTNDRIVYGCGSNEEGQLGLGIAIKDSCILAKIEINGVQSIITDAYSSIFQINTQILYGTGQNTLGELGLGDNINRYSPELLLYTDIWMDSLTEEIIVTPDFDYHKQLNMVDGLLLSGVDKYICVLDKDLIFTVYNKFDMGILDIVYFYIENGVIKFSRTKQFAFNEDGSRKYDIDSRYETINNPFVSNKEYIEFSINNCIYRYNAISLNMELLYTGTTQCTSICNTLAIFEDIMINLETLNVFTSSVGMRGTYHYLEIDIDSMKGFSYRDNIGYFRDKNDTVFSVDFKEKITASCYISKRLYVGTKSGCLYLIMDETWVKSNNIIPTMFKKFTGEITLLHINSNTNELNKTLLIDEQSRYIIIGFADGKYKKYPLYKVPKISFICKDIYFIDEKVYYNIIIKLDDYDRKFHNNIRFLVHNTYNDIEITAKDYEFNGSTKTISRTISFEKKSLSVYNYIRLNYMYGNNTLGTVYQKLSTVKINLIYKYGERILLNISNYSSVDATLVFEQVYDNGLSKVIDAKPLKTGNDHDFIFFDGIKNDVKQFNLKAVYGDNETYLYTNEEIESITFHSLIDQTSYNGEILLDFDRLVNRLYEDVNLTNISLEKITSIINALSHKKLEYVDLLENNLLDSDVKSDVYGNAINILQHQGNRYRTITDPDNIRYRDHYRANVYINGLKVPYTDVDNNFDIENGLFTTYYIDENTEKQAKNFVDISLYTESLILAEKEVYQYNISRDNNNLELLENEGITFSIPQFSEYLNSSYLSIYVKFRHGTFWNRVNTKDYNLILTERTSSYCTFRLKMYNEVLRKIGGEIHVVMSDLDKENSIIFRDTTKNSTELYKNYFTPLLCVDEKGYIINYYTEKSENIEVYVSGFMLTPYVDYKVVNFPLHMQLPTMIVFRHPICSDLKIEISILKENYLDSVVKEKSSNEYIINIDDETFHLPTNHYLPLLYNTYDKYVDGVKVPNLLEDGKKVHIPESGLRNRSWEYIRFYLEDNDVTRFMAMLLKLKLKTSQITKPTNIGTITEGEYNVTKPSITNLYKDNSSDGLLFFLFEQIDNAIIKDTDVIFDCNDSDQIQFVDDILLDSNIYFNLPYITSNLLLNCNQDYSKNFYKNEMVYDI